MSLISTASLWTNDNTSNTTKKRVPALQRKTQKVKPYELEDTGSGFENNNVDNKLDKVNEIINQMTDLSVENDGAKLADFNPPPNPEIQMKKEIDLQIPGPPTFQHSMNPYIVSNAGSLANYQQVYNPQNMEYKEPYYSKMGISNSPMDNKMTEKLNYMIHLLENLENEKTANIAEEFVLYTFLGVFIIFVLDSFSGKGKYIR